MKNYSAYFAIALIMLLGLTAFYIVNADTKTVDDPWKTWVEQQTETMLKAAGDIDKERWTEMQSNIKEQFSAIAAELKKDISSPPMFVKENIDHDIKKTLKYLLTEEIINSKKIDDLIKKITDEDLSYIEERVVVDKLPESKLHKGNSKIQVKTYFDTKNNDLEITSEAHVNAHILRDLFDKDIRNLPKDVDQNVDALREAYDKAYNGMLKTSSQYFTHQRDGKVVLKYKIPAPIEVVDEKYPRDEWLQMLLDEKIKISNFYEYQAYLLERDVLVHIEKNPKVWSSGLFGIDATDDWETYKEAYMQERVYKLKPFIRSQIIIDAKKISEMKEKILKQSEDMKHDTDEVAEKVRAIVEELNKKSTTALDKADIVKLIDVDPIITKVTPSITTKPYVHTKVLKALSTENELEKKIEKLVDRIDKLIDKLEENQSQSTETE